MRQRPFCGVKPQRHKVTPSAGPSERKSRTSPKSSALVVIEGDLIDALCAEPAVEAFGSQAEAMSLVIGGAFADVYAGHPNVRGLLFPDTETQTEGFDRVLTIPAGAGGMSAAERIAAAAGKLTVTPQRLRPRLYLTGLDTLRAERLELERLGRTIALCLTEQAFCVPALRQRWNTVCHLLRQRPHTAVVLLAGQEQSLSVQKDLAGRLTAREIAAAVSRCAVWAGDDSVCAALAGATGSPGVFVSDNPMFDGTFEMVRCGVSASAEEIAAALDKLMMASALMNQV